MFFPHKKKRNAYEIRMFCTMEDDDSAGMNAVTLLFYECVSVCVAFLQQPRFDSKRITHGLASIHSHDLAI